MMTEQENDILAVLDRMRGAGEVYREVPDSTGRMLRLLTEAVGARNVVEVGTSTGCSGLWFCLALRRTGGELMTFEGDSGRAAMARRHFQQARVDQTVTIVEGNAHDEVSRLRDPIDVLFLDADKIGYEDYLRQLLPLVRPGGLILADNQSMVPRYVERVTGDPDLETLFHGELVITLKKR
jgi:caffeoyl-CoA O-methyltransferase